MYLKEVSIVYDNYSGRKSISNDELIILGSNGLRNKNKKLIAQCSECAKDEDLYGDGIFLINTSAFNAGIIPCGCSPIHIKDERQRIIVATRILKDKDCEFVGWEGEYKGIYSIYRGLCKEHGEFSSKFSILIAHKSTCQLCGWRSKISDDEWIARFKSSGGFSEGARFWRSTKKSKAGFRSYWNVYCDTCGETSSAISTTLARGSSPCLCNTNKQTKAYIMLIKDGSTPIALKFGITANPSRRLSQQIEYSKPLDVEICGVWYFPNRASCWDAELRCKQDLICGILSKREIRHGFTETTSILNYDKVVEIYKDCGGIEEVY